MKHCLILLTILSISLNAFSQSMVSIFRMLPVNCTPDLNLKAKNILLKSGTYILPGGDSVETVQYEIDTTHTDDYIYFGSSFTTGQNGFDVFQIRKFKRANGKSFIIFSQYAGVKIEFSQRQLRVFNIENNRLIESKEPLLPKNIEIVDFLEKDIPDSIRQSIMSNASTSYNLDRNSKNAIGFRIFFYGGNDEYEKYLKGNVILFTWNGSSFIKEIIKD